MKLSEFLRSPITKRSLTVTVAISTVVQMALITAIIMSGVGRERVNTPQVRDAYRITTETNRMLIEQGQQIDRLIAAIKAALRSKEAGNG